MPIKYQKPQLKINARKLRSEMTDAERKLWSGLRGKQIAGLQFYRQRPLGLYIVDFYCPKKNLAIEIDGGQHYEIVEIKKDKERSEYLKKRFGLNILRFTNIEILKNLEGGMQKIVEEIK
jgi:very-short-patch-repair endonuclease